MRASGEGGFFYTRLLADPTLLPDLNIAFRSVFASMSALSIFL